MTTKTKPPAAKFKCKFCGEWLVGPGADGQMFIVPSRGDRQLRSASGNLTNHGECLNRAGTITKHHPDAPEWNGGIDYSDGRARVEKVVV